MKKRLLSAALLIMLVSGLTLGGCGAKDSKTDNGKQEESVSIAPATEISTSEARFTVKQQAKGSLMLSKYVGTDTKLDIPSTIDGYSVSVIEQATFKDCTALEEVTIPATVECINSNLFSGCTALKVVNIPGSVESIRAFAFYGCSALKEITLPESVKSIVANAFEGTDKAFVIKGKAGSYAETFAKENKITFVAE